MFKLHANVVPQEGPYAGLIMHIVLYIPPNFPQGAPAGSMGRNFPFGNVEHEHIYSCGLCTDYLANFQSYFQSIDGGQIQTGSGWTPSITVSKLLIALQQFFLQTDRSEPSGQQVSEMKEKIKSYACPECSHTTEKPFPPIKLSSQASEDSEKKEKTSPEVEKTQDEKRNGRTREEIEELLRCSFTQEGLFSSGEVQQQTILGFPVDVGYDKRRRLHSEVIPELISYDYFVSMIQTNDSKLDSYGSTKFRSASGKPYNQFLPIYISEQHFQRAQQHILNAVSIFSSGSAQGTAKNDFQSYQVLRVLLNLMNQTIVKIFKCEVHESENIILAYCHLMRLLLRMIEMYPKIVGQVEEILEKFMRSPEGRSKKAVPDLGEFIIMLGINLLIHKEEDKRPVAKLSFHHPTLKKYLMDEFFARQIFWIENEHPDLFILANSTPPPPAVELLNKAWKVNEVSNKLLVFNVMFSKFFVFKGVAKCLDFGYSLPPVNVVNDFQKLIKKIKAISFYPEFLKAISYDAGISDPVQMLGQLKNAHQLSISQGYSKSSASSQNNSQSTSAPPNSRNARRK